MSGSPVLRYNALFLKTLFLKTLFSERSQTFALLEERDCHDDGLCVTLAKNGNGALMGRNQVESNQVFYVKYLIGFRVYFLFSTCRNFDKI